MDTAIKKSKVLSKRLEGSNVEAVDEMVKPVVLTLDRLLEIVSIAFCCAIMPDAPVHKERTIDKAAWSSPM